MLVAQPDRCGQCGYPVDWGASRCSECGATDRREHRQRCFVVPGFGAWAEDVLLAHRAIGRRTRLETGSGVIAVGVLNLVLGGLLIGFAHGACAMVHTLVEDGAGFLILVPAMLPLATVALALPLIGGTMLLLLPALLLVFTLSRVLPRAASPARWADALAQWSFLGLQARLCLSMMAIIVLGALAGGALGNRGIWWYERWDLAVLVAASISVDALIIVLGLTTWLSVRCPRRGPSSIVASDAVVAK